MQKEKTRKTRIVYGVVSELLDPTHTGGDMKMREMKQTKGLIGVTFITASAMLWYYDNQKHADDAILKLISLKLSPEKTYHKFKYDGEKIIDFIPSVKPVPEVIENERRGES